MHVLEDEQRGPIGRQPPEDRQHALLHAPGDEGLIGLGAVLAERRHQAGQLRAKRPEHALQLRPRRRARQPAQRLGQRQERQAAIGQVQAGADHHPTAVALHGLRQLGDEARLPDPRFAGDQHDARRSGGGRLERGDEPLEVAVATDEGVGRCDGVPGLPGGPVAHASQGTPARTARTPRPGWCVLTTGPIVAFHRVPRGSPVAVVPGSRSWKHLRETWRHWRPSPCCSPPSCRSCCWPAIGDRSRLAWTGRTSEMDALRERLAEATRPPAQFARMRLRESAVYRFARLRRAVPRRSPLTDGARGDPRPRPLTYGIGSGASRKGDREPIDPERERLVDVATEPERTGQLHADEAVGPGDNHPRALEGPLRSCEGSPPP